MPISFRILGKNPLCKIFLSSLPWDYLCRTYIESTYLCKFLKCQKWVHSDTYIQAVSMTCLLSEGVVASAWRGDAHWSRRAQKHAKLHYPRVHAMIWLRMTKNWYITDCYVQLIFCHTESNLSMNSRVMEFRMFLSSSRSVCGARCALMWTTSNIVLQVPFLSVPHYRDAGGFCTYVPT